ncbi:YHS domain-containing (seleno)protein [Terrimonas pollutisoli]|uniref:YHS domain-containing (seleno)protein n=1 Tax=Terrimonas pollutisoli TaxID=3034147 RepID=UPI0023ED430B|nr:YHS domain-containing (seleno)protein [Terrimonas sp. H1YJ31]
MDTRIKALRVEQIQRKKAGEKRLFMYAFATIMLLFAMLLAVGSYAQEHSGKPFNNVDANGVILDGYDAVAFFTDNKPVKGDAKFQYKYEDAIYQFASQEHLDLFKAMPEKYKPQFGAWCAYAVSLGRVAPIDVNTFSIVNDRLVIQHNQRAVNGWKKDVQGNLALADKYWPKVAEKGGKQITTDAEKSFLNNTDPDGVTLQGYDAVAYFTQMKAVKGDPKYAARYNGATYWFSSESNAGMFKDHPEMFAPQFGAFCGYAMALNKLRPIDPEIFDVIDGRLILQHSKDAYERFHKDVAGLTAKADHNWPGQVKKHAGKKVKFDKPAKPTETVAAN